jgi:HU domain-containing protein
MATKIQAWVEFGPRLEPTDPITAEGMIERIVTASNQSRGSVKAILDELDVQTEIALKEGHIVQLPNGTHFKPSGHKDGSIDVNVRVNPRVVKNLNTGFRGRWKNAENIGKSEAEIIALWNAAHPEDPITEETQPQPG